MKGAKIVIVLSVMLLFLVILSSAIVLAESGQSNSDTRANENATTYIFLDASIKEKTIIPSETIAYEIKVRNLGDDDVAYTPPSISSLNLPTGWQIVFEPNSEFFITGNGYELLYVNLTAPADAKADTALELVLIGSASDSEAEIIPVELSTTVNQIYGTTCSVIDKITLDSPTVPRNIEISVTNSGNGNDWLSLEITGIPTGLSFTQEAQEFVIDAWEQEDLGITLHPSSVLTAGEYNINLSIFRVDETPKVLVSSQNLIVEVKYYPDLYISTGDIELSRYTPWSGENVTINITVHNIGGSDARNITVRITPVTRSGSQLQDVADVVIDFLGLNKSALIHVPWLAKTAVNKLLVTLDPGENIHEMSETNNKADINFYVIPEKPPSTGETSVGEFTTNQVFAVAIVAILTGITATVGVSFLTTEYGKYGLLKVLIPFYTRVKKEEVLNHEVRELVYDYVKTHPGEHYRAILAKLGLTNGTLIHHLHTLERQKFVKSERDGPFKRFYPTGRQLTEDVLEINGIQKKIMDAITSTPGVTQKDLALQLNTSPPTINYHIKALQGVRLVDVKREGKNTHIFPGESMNGWFRSGKVS